MPDYSKDIEKMISKVMSKKGLPRTAAIGYMLGVATGRLNALWRYDKTLPDGKATKGILRLVGRKKRAPKSARISTLPTPAKRARKPPKKRRKAQVVESEVAA